MRKTIESLRNDELFSIIKQVRESIEVNNIQLIENRKKEIINREANK